MYVWNLLDDCTTGQVLVLLCLVGYQDLEDAKFVEGCLLAHFSFFYKCNPR